MINVEDVSVNDGEESIEFEEGVWGYLYKISDIIALWLLFFEARKNRKNKENRKQRKKNYMTKKSVETLLAIPAD